VTKQARRLILKLEKYIILLLQEKRINRKLLFSLKLGVRGFDILKSLARCEHASMAGSISRGDFDLKGKLKSDNDDYSHPLKQLMHHLETRCV
jgi:hypothetical protein